MSVDIARQLGGLCQAVLLGGALGLVYDALRLTRRLLPRRGVAAALDLLFWMVATAALFVFSHRAWGGQIRWYGAVFCAMGGAAYFWGISPTVMRVSLWLAGILGRILSILTLPARRGGAALKRFVKITKTSFLSGKNGV